MTSLKDFNQTRYKCILQSNKDVMKSFANFTLIGTAPILLDCFFLCIDPFNGLFFLSPYRVYISFQHTMVQLNGFTHVM